MRYYQKMTKLVTYIEENPGCTITDLKAHFHAMANIGENINVEKPPLDETIPYTTLYKYLKFLIKNKSALKKDGGYAINPHVYDVAGELTSQIQLGEKQEVLNQKISTNIEALEKNLYDLILNDIKVYPRNFNQKKHDLKFSDTTRNLFSDLFYALLHDIFIMNPEVWPCYETAEDFNFGIVIDVKLGENPLFYNIFQKLKQQYRELKEIKPVLFSTFTRKESLKLDDDELQAYKTALFESIQYEKIMLSLPKLRQPLKLKDRVEWNDGNPTILEKNVIPDGNAQLVINETDGSWHVQRTPEMKPILNALDKLISNKIVKSSNESSIKTKGKK